MSRSLHPSMTAGSKRWARKARALRTFEHRASRTLLRRVLAAEARGSVLDDLALEVLADHEEEAGRLEYAQLLRRGRDVL
jgi:hypothetical protein